MDQEQKKYYTTMAEKIFAIPAGERRQYLENLKKADKDFYERIEYLTRFLASRENDVEGYAQDRIKEILSDIESRS